MALSAAVTVALKVLKMLASVPVSIGEAGGGGKITGMPVPCAVPLSSINASLPPTSTFPPSPTRFKVPVRFSVPDKFKSPTSCPGYLIATNGCGRPFADYQVSLDIGRTGNMHIAVERNIAYQIYRVAGDFHCCIVF